MAQHSVFKTGLWTAAASLALGIFAPLASAQPNNDHRGAPQAHPQPPRAQAHTPPRPQAHTPPQQHRPGAAMPGNGQGHAQAPGRGAGPNHNLHRGGKLPPAWRSNHYVVDDWRGHGLSRPPRGYHWVQAGSDYLLVAIASGLIAQVILR